MAGRLHKQLQYASDLVRKSDYAAYLNSFFYPAHLRPFYLTLRAINVELTSIDDNVSNQTVGLMRFRWWKDTVKAALAGQPPPHPLAELLAHSAQRQYLSSYHFNRLIRTREDHFTNSSFQTLHDLGNYSQGTQASMLYLLLQACAAPVPGSSSSSSSTPIRLPHDKPFEHKGDEHLPSDQPSTSGDLKPPSSLVLDHAASHLSVTIAISILLRGLPHHASKRISVMPVEIASRYGLNEEALFRYGPEAEGLRDSVANLVDIAENELKTSRSCFDGTTGLPAGVVPVFLAAAPARGFLDRLKAVDYDVFNSTLRKRDWKEGFRIWNDNRKQRY